MINIKKEDVLHKSYLNRILIEIADSPLLSQNLAFKGGTCASMLGYLDRFSVDLDFDLLGDVKESEIRKELHKIFSGLGLTVVKEFKNVLLFAVKYPNELKGRTSAAQRWQLLRIPA